MLFGGFVDVNEDNYVLILVGVGVAALVLLVLVAVLSRLFSDPADSDEKWIEAIKENGKPSEGLSLREKFAQAGLDVRNKKDGQGKQHNETVKSASEPEEEGGGNIHGSETNQDVQEKNEEDAENSDEEKGGNTVVSDEAETAVSEKTILPVKEEDEQKNEAATKPGKVYSKDEFMKTFKEPITMGKETKKIRISLTSKRGNKAVYYVYILSFCWEGELNPHLRRGLGLNLARLPVPPSQLYPSCFRSSFGFICFSEVFLADVPMLNTVISMMWKDSFGQFYTLYRVMCNKGVVWVVQVKCRHIVHEVFLE